MYLSLSLLLCLPLCLPAFLSVSLSDWTYISQVWYL